MSVSDLDIFRTANTRIELHGDHAVAKARERSAEFRAKGHDEGADTWLRVIVALETLRQGPVGMVS